MDTNIGSHMALRKGWASSEFWLSTAASLVGALLASGVLPVGHWSVQLAGLVASALASLGYSVSRGNVKAAALAPVDPAQLLAADAVKRIEPSKSEP